MLESTVQQDTEARKYEVRQHRLAPVATFRNFKPGDAHDTATDTTLHGHGSAPSRPKNSPSRGLNIIKGPDGEGNMVFRFVSRASKGGKQQTLVRGLPVPLESDIAGSIIAQERAERREKEEMKRLLVENLEREAREQHTRETRELQRIKNNSAWGAPNEEPNDLDIDFSHRRINPSKGQKKVKEITKHEFSSKTLGPRDKK